MRQPLKYTVTYSDQQAKFSGYGHALEFAKHISGMGGWFVEVRDKTGLVMQYEDGIPTAEFRLRLVK